MSGATVRCKFVAAAKQAPCRPVTRAANSPKPRGPSLTARMLALAHHIERRIDAGAIPDYATAARALGVTRARLTQLMNLLLLIPEIQQQVLLGCQRNTERALRLIAQEAEWCDQRTLFHSARSSGTDSA